MNTAPQPDPAGPASEPPGSRVAGPVTDPAGGLVTAPNGGVSDPRWRWEPTGWRQFLPPPDRLPVSDGELGLLIVCTLVTTIGLAGDIARHLTDPGDLQGDFLSGWHLVLYGGVAAVGVWIAMGAMRRGTGFVGSVPTTTIGFLALVVGGGVDSAWHEAFGTEQAVEALVSPPHLIVFFGLVLLLSSPLVLLWHRPVDRLGLMASLVAVVSVVSATLVTSLFTGFLSPMAGGLSLQAGYVEPLVGESMNEYDQVRGLGVVLWSAVLVLTGFLILAGRFRVKPGLSLLGMFMLGVPPVVLSAREVNPQLPVTDSLPALPVLAGFVTAGLVLEVCLAVLGRPTLSRAAACITGFLVASSHWATSFLVLRHLGRLGWTVTLTTGSVLLAGLAGAAVGALVMLRVAPLASEARPVGESR